MLIQVVFMSVWSKIISETRDNSSWITDESLQMLDWCLLWLSVNDVYKTKSKSDVYACKIFCRVKFVWLISISMFEMWLVSDTSEITTHWFATFCIPYPHVAWNNENTRHKMWYTEANFANMRSTIPAMDNRWILDLYETPSFKQYCADLKSTTNLLGT